MKPAKHTGAFCATCQQVFDDSTCPFWHWTKAQTMHERGTGHKVVRFNHRTVDLVLLADASQLVEL